MLNFTLSLFAIAVVTWLLVQIPMREPHRTAIVVIAALLALVVCLRYLFPGTLGGL